MSHPFRKRLLKEYSRLQTAQLPGISVSDAEDDFLHFTFSITIQGAHEIYKDGEVFQLDVSIPQEYPIKPPVVKFVKSENSNIPMHPHIYSNGHICLNILGKDWTPACSLESVLLSLQSMICSNKVAERPPDDKVYSATAPKDPSKTTFMYHDDNI